MASIGATFVINPFKSFGEHLGLAMQSVSHFNLEDWLTGVPGAPHKSIQPPPRGLWIICGYGRFGKAVVDNLNQSGIETRIIEADPALTGCGDCVVGTGSEAGTLLEAGIDNAVGIVAGVNDDHKNLGIALTARKLRPDIFVVVRKNRRYNAQLFEHFRADLTMQTSRIISHECLGHLVWPLLTTFLTRVRRKPDDWVERIYQKALERIGPISPETWEITIDPIQTPALIEYLESGQEIPLNTLIADPSDPDRFLACMPLLHVRGDHKRMRLRYDLKLQAGDCLLFCGSNEAQRTQVLAMEDVNTLHYLLYREERNRGTLWRWLSTITKKVPSNQSDETGIIQKTENIRND